MKTTKQNFLSILSSKKPEDMTELIFKNSKIKPITNLVVRIKPIQNLVAENKPVENIVVRNIGYPNNK